MKNKSFPRRLMFALQGLRGALRSESSLRWQVLAAVAAILLLCILRPAPVWWALFALSMGGVLASEMLNTALEHILDLLHPQQHPAVAFAKDCAAGAVLLMSVASLVVAIAFLFEVGLFS